MSSRRSKEEQKAAEKFHREKCCTTKWMCWGIIIMFIGLVLLITAVGLGNAWEMDKWAGAQFQEECYIQAQDVPCRTISCDDEEQCSINTYFVKVDDDRTCARGECATWDNGCEAITFTTECDRQHEYEDDEWVSCYAYANPDEGVQGEEVCREEGRIDPDGLWLSQRTTYIVLLVFAIIFIIVAVVLFVVGAIRCLFKKMDDDILGSTNGTGCYWCMDWERCCYGEGTGHATVVNPSGRNLPVKDKKRRQKKHGTAGRTAPSNDYDDDDEDAGLR